MLSTNKTFLLQDILLSSIEDHQLSCFVHMQHSPYIHLIIILFVQFIFIKIYFILIFIYLFLVFLSPYFRNFHRHINETIQLRFYEQEKANTHGIIFLLENEIILTLVYILFAFLYKWFGLMNNEDYITPTNFHRWLIEASTIPHILLCMICNYCIKCGDNFFDEFKSFHVHGIKIKIPLFFFMRYAENQPDLFLKEMKTWIFYALCQSSSK
ncbi:unnamed protein product [Rotaria sp. Silwood2]|nr:unnamed protein product [Rotaria sp. Silwood2]CAF3220244.1 unnamed protein product [Rotaria sp. Silwood2]CAF3470186.1 unnamed protein product [Rotaria sp. Silwood2]CAF4510284.1 unnamed protein product [Rotaria sp. Silwood2]CAF4565785.1 unnamed protein product [Rotaria sp. Silwood2]